MRFQEPVLLFPHPRTVIWGRAGRLFAVGGALGFFGYRAPPKQRLGCCLLSHSDTRFSSWQVFRASIS